MFAEKIGSRPTIQKNNKWQKGAFNSEPSGISDLRCYLYTGKGHQFNITWVKVYMPTVS
jgi:hypothetical protein